MPARSLLRRCSVSALAVATMMLFGCESSDVDLSSNWNNSSSSNSTQTSGDTQTSTDSSSDATAGSTAGEQESFSSFNFCYGGFDGSAAVQSGVQISSLSFASDGLTFRYVTDLSAWGLSYTDASGALVYRDCGRDRDFSLFGKVVNTLKRQPWFMENVAAWRLYDSDDSDHPDDFNEEDLLRHYRRKQVQARG